ncbi:MAG: glycosyltransferase, partial [Muribaculaceae bacterium]|nr:glycosyltransferase [Muribaculaceae bacterium]
STDNSQEICKEYTNSYSKIKVFNKINGGLSSARNYGLIHAHGEFVGFVDSDDWIASDMYETLYKLVRRNNNACGQIAIELTDNPNIRRSDYSEKTKIISGRENILRYYLDSSTRQAGGYAVWRCLFPSRLAKKYRFREGKVNEDIDYKYQILSECASFVVSDKVCYYYFQQGDSLSSGILKKRDFDLYDAAEELRKLTDKEDDRDIRFLGKVKEARTPFSLLCRIAYYGVDKSCGDKKTLIKKLTKQHRHNLPILLTAPLPLSRKLVALGLALNFRCLSVPLAIKNFFR